MKIDLRILNSLKQIKINETLIIPKEYYQNLDILSLKNIKIKGEIIINNQSKINLNVIITGTFILPCSVSLAPVNYNFKTNINEIIPENHNKQEFRLELLDILWENIVSEDPIKVSKPEIEIENIEGIGWKLEKEIN
ncbi:MAG: hypothetical protein PHF21_02870 [Bacilli bacterium]|nr:hypothetical protein [Bacilli bacterium]